VQDVKAPESDDAGQAGGSQEVEQEANEAEQSDATPENEDHVSGEETGGSVESETSAHDEEVQEVPQTSNDTELPEASGEAGAASEPEDTVVVEETENSQSPAES